MTKKEAIDIIQLAIAQVEWEYPMDYTAALDMAIEALKADRPSGRWIGSECSVCHDDLMNYQYELPIIEYAICPFCGADMRES